MGETARVSPRNRNAEPNAGEREQNVRDRALRSLDNAFKQANDQLSPSWVERDPDQAVFKDPLDKDWDRLVNRAAQHFPRTTRTLSRLPKDGREQFPFPPRPWGNAAGRARLWLTLVLFSIVALKLTIERNWGAAYIVSVSLVLAFALWRLRFARWETGLVLEEKGLARLTRRRADTKRPSQ
jgi:hypothetical protein